MKPLEAVKAFFRTQSVRRIFLLALLLRLAIAPFTEHRWDLYVARLWGAFMYNYGLNPFRPEPVVEQLGGNYLNYVYPPVWLGIISLIYPIWLAITHYPFGANPTALFLSGLNPDTLRVDNIFEAYRSFPEQQYAYLLPSLDLMLKLPIIASDILIGYLLYKLMARTHPGLAKAVVVLWLFNPYTIHNTAVLGEFDAISTLFAVAAVYLVAERRYSLGFGLLALGVGTKIYPIFLLPLLLLFASSRSGIRTAVKQLLLFMAATFAIFSVFLFIPHGIDTAIEILWTRASPDWFGQNLVSGLSWFSVVGVAWEGNIPLFPLFFTPLYIYILARFRKAEGSTDDLLAFAAATLLLVYLTYTVVNEQYPYWALPFLLYTTISKNLLRWGYAAFSAIPLLYSLRSTPLYFLSPAVIWDERSVEPLEAFVRWIYPYAPALGAMVVVAFASVCVWLLLLSLKERRTT